MPDKYVRSLYKMPRGVWIELLGEEVTTPPASPDSGKVVYFEHVDGMYSLCRTPDGAVVHPAAWTKARIVDAPEGHCLECGAEKRPCGECEDLICYECGEHESCVRAMIDRMDDKGAP